MLPLWKCGELDLMLKKHLKNKGALLKALRFPGQLLTLLTIKRFLFANQATLRENQTRIANKHQHPAEIYTVFYTSMLRTG